jgi:hypothetical protein
MMINRTTSSDFHSTGKLYEYFGAGKPVLACVPEGVARESLKEHKAARIAEPDDVNSISEFIIEFYKHYKNNSLPVPDEKFIKKYDRKNLTGELAGLFNEIIFRKTEKVPE